MGFLLVIPERWVTRFEPLPDGWLARKAPGLVRAWRESGSTVERVAREVGVSAKLLVTRMEVEQSAISYAWDGSSGHYGGGAMGDRAKLRYLCGADRTDAGERPDGWFGPELQLYGCAVRFRYVYRGRTLPSELAERLPPVPREVAVLGEDPRYAPGVAVTRAGKSIVPANQASADCLRYTSSLDASRKLAAIGRAWFPRDYEEEEGGLAMSRSLRVLLDPGHGTLKYDSGQGKWVRDTGAAGGGLGEAEVNLAVALELARVLRDEGHTVELSHETIDYTRKLGPTARGEWAAAREYDVFVSIHHDSSTNPAARGTHAFYANENCTKGKALASALAHAVRDEFGVPFSYRDRGEGCSQHWLDLGVFAGGGNWRKPGAAALIECMFMSNAADLAIVRSDGYALRAARAIADGIGRYAGLKGSAPPAETWQGELAGAATWAREQGISDSTRLGEPVTRGELLVMLQRALGAK